MEFEKTFIGISLFLMVCVVGLLLYSDGANNYGVTVQNDSFLDITQESIDLAAKQEILTSKITGGEVSQDNAIDNMIYGANLAIRSILTYISSVGKIGGILLLELGPLAGYPILIITVITIIGFLFIAGIIYLIMRIST